MNVTGTTTNFDPNLVRAGYNGIDETKVVAASRQAEIAPLLFGSNILVSYGISDAEALVARLKVSPAVLRRQRVFRQRVQRVQPHGQADPRQRMVHHRSNLPDSRSLLSISASPSR